MRAGARDGPGFRRGDMVLFFALIAKLIGIMDRIYVRINRK